jgi:hypothetical protein
VLGDGRQGHQWANAAPGRRRRRRARLAIAPPRRRGGLEAVERLGVVGGDGRAAASLGPESGEGPSVPAGRQDRGRSQKPPVVGLRDVRRPRHGNWWLRLRGGVRAGAEVAQEHPVVACFRRR